MAATPAMARDGDSVRADDANFTDFLEAQARARAGELALLHPGGALCYGELDERIWSAAAFLHEQGIVAGDVVTPAFDDELSTLLVTAAAMRLGAAVFSRPRGFAGASLARELSRAGVTSLVTARPTAMTGVREIVLDPTRRLASSRPYDRSIRASNPTAPAVLVSGSGTTGRSKLISTGHRAYLHRLERTFVRAPTEPDDRVFSLVHSEYDAGRRTVLATLYHGGVAVFADRQGGTLAGVCRRFAITVVWTTASDLEIALDQLPSGTTAPALPGLRELYVGTSTVGVSLRERAMRRLTPHLYVRYGINECGPISIATPEQVASLPGTVGKPCSGVRIDLVDVRGVPAGPGEVGEVRVGGPGLFSEYVGDPEATARVLRDGWFHSGDLARWSADGQLVHCGRVDDLMIVSGINIYPAEIERVLGEHPAVREAAAFPVPSRIAQEIPVCAVTLHAGARVSGDELLRYARDRLGARAPRFVTVLESFPRTSQGKPDRKALRQAVLQDMTRQRRPAAADAPGKRAQIAFRCPSPQGVDALSPWFAEWLRIDAPVDAAAVEAAPEEAAPEEAAPADAALAGAALADDAPGDDAPADDAPGKPPLRDEASRAARRFLLHALALATRLLQAGGVPAFASAGIEDCTPLPNEPGRWRAVVVLPVVDRIDPAAYDLALRAALEACGTMSQLPWGDASRAMVDTSLGQAMRRIGALVPHGRSTIPLLRAASECGIPFLHLGQGVYQLGWGSKGVRTNRSATARDSAIGARLAQSKSGAAELLRAAGLPVPMHGLASTVEQAVQLARRIGWPVVLKPDDADRGEGVSVDVDSDERLIAAFRAARERRPNTPVLVERQVPGVCHRLFVARGRLLYAVRRLPKSVIGDGRSSVAALIAEANRAEQSLPPWSRTEPYPDDAQARAAIEAAGFTRDAVPDAGVPVPLRRIESTADGGFDQEVSAEVHPANVEAALRAASLFDLDVAGIDLISTDIGEPWYRNGAVINEVNCAPLLGGGEISRRHIPEYLARIVEGDGRIPVEIVDDRSADLAEARRRQQAWAQRGMRCWVTSATRTLDAQGREHPMPFTTLEERFRALVLDRRVDAVVGSGLAFPHLTPAAPGAPPPVR